MQIATDEVIVTHRKCNNGNKRKPRVVADSRAQSSRYAASSKCFFRTSWLGKTCVSLRHNLGSTRPRLNFVWPRPFLHWEFNSFMWAKSLEWRGLKRTFWACSSKFFCVYILAQKDRQGCPISDMHLIEQPGTTTSWIVLQTGRASQFPMESN